MQNEQLAVNKDPNGIISNIKCFALDLDGTVYLENQWIDGAVEFLQCIRQSGRKYIFMTNNSSRSAQNYLEKLAGMGLDIQLSQLVTSGDSTIRFLQRHYPGQRVFLLGNEVLQQGFMQQGILLDDKTPQLVVTAFDTSLTYQKLCQVCGFVRAGLPYIATHPDVNCPVKEGFVPDIGAFHALIEASTGRKPDKVIGKPNREIVEDMLALAGAGKEETCVVGDRLYTDIAAGVHNGMASILVLSGESSLQDMWQSDVQPNLVFSSVKEITPLL